MNQIFRDVSVKCGLFMMAYYITNSIFQTFMSLFYVDRGLSNTQIGLINSMIALVSVFAMQLWGAAGDRAKSRNRLLCLMAVCASMLALSLFLSSAVFYLLTMSCAFAFFYTSLQPMGDSIILESLEPSNRPFGPVRMAGGVSFAVMAMVFGRVLDGVGDANLIVYSIGGMCLITALAAMYLPPVSGTGKRKRGGNMLGLLKNKALMRLFLLMVPLQITLGYFYAFFSPMFKNDIPGGNETLLGWCFFISAMSEVPFLLNADRLFKKYGAGKLICVTAMTFTLRWLIVAVAKSAIVAMLSQLLHFWGIIVIMVTMSKHIQATVPDDQKASGQLLISVFGFGVARVIGYFGGGLLSDLTSRQDVFFVCSGICLVCSLVFTPHYFRKPKAPKG